MTAAVILAGGNSRRMGRDKLSLAVSGSTLLESAIDRFKEKFELVCLSVSDLSKYPEVSIPKIADIIPSAGPLSGLHAALSSLTTEGVFLIAADLPFADADAALKIIELAAGKDSCVIKLPNGNMEPLFGYYGKSLLPRCEELLSSGDFRMTSLFSKSGTRFVSPDELGSVWNESIIMNINYPEDYDALMHRMPSN